MTYGLPVISGKKNGGHERYELLKVGRRKTFTNMELQDSTVCFLYDQLRVETIRYLEDYIRTERGTLAELKDRFRRSLPEEERRRVRTVKKLVDTLEERSVIGPDNVKVLKMLAEALKSPELKENIEEFETKCSGKIMIILS